MAANLPRVGRGGAKNITDTKFKGWVALLRAIFYIRIPEPMLELIN